MRAEGDTDVSSVCVHMRKAAFACYGRSVRRAARCGLWHCDGAARARAVSTPETSRTTPSSQKDMFKNNEVRSSATYGNHSPDRYRHRRVGSLGNGAARGGHRAFRMATSAKTRANRASFADTANSATMANRASFARQPRTPRPRRTGRTARRSVDTLEKIVSYKRVTASAHERGSRPAARAAATEVPLFSRGPFSFYGKCFVGLPAWTFHQLSPPGRRDLGLRTTQAGLDLRGRLSINIRGAPELIGLLRSRHAGDRSHRRSPRRQRLAKNGGALNPEDAFVRGQARRHGDLGADPTSQSSGGDPLRTKTGSTEPATSASSGGIRDRVAPARRSR